MKNMLYIRHPIKVALCAPPVDLRSKPTKMKIIKLSNHVLKKIPMTETIRKIMSICTIAVRP